MVETPMQGPDRMLKSDEARMQMQRNSAVPSEIRPQTDERNFAAQSEICLAAS